MENANQPTDRKVEIEVPIEAIWNPEPSQAVGAASRFVWMRVYGG